MLHVLPAFAEFETELHHERQMTGIAKTKAAAVYKGRKPIVAVEAVRSLGADGVGPADIARRLGIGRASVYRALARLKFILAVPCFVSTRLLDYSDFTARMPLAFKIVLARG